MSTETGTLWVCGAATQGQFLSCPISKRVRAVSAAGRKVAATLEDGKVLFLDLERASAESSASSSSSSRSVVDFHAAAVAAGKPGPESEGGQLVAVPWTAAEHVPAAATALSGGGSFGVLLSTSGEVFTWGDSNKWGELGLGGRVVGDVGTHKKGTRLEHAVVAQATGSLLAKNIKQVAAGSAHAMALSEAGTLYAWGRGFEGQTGLVGEQVAARRLGDGPQVPGPQTKPPGVVLSPKLVKFSSERPVATVACGHNFTVAIVKQGGVLYAWGEGGCGQLGIGRCKKYLERPTPCDASAIKRASRKLGGGTSGGNGGAKSGGLSPSGSGGAAPPFLDVSCGWAHCLARNSNDEVYVWGLNAHGQLGLGHTDAVHHPVLLKDPYAEASEEGFGFGGQDDGAEGGHAAESPIDADELPPLYLRDVSAYGSGSAGVRPDGRVLSWGSSRSGRLGHGDDAGGNATAGSGPGGGGGRSVLEPKLIAGIAGQRISTVKLAAEELVAFAPTTLVQLEPAAGPLQGNSRLVISGSGLWASNNIVVRFEPVPLDALAKMHPAAEFEPFPRARSTIGKFHEDPLTGAQSISCRTPNMADTQKALKKLMAAYGAGADGTGGSGAGGSQGSGAAKGSAPTALARQGSSSSGSALAASSGRPGGSKAQLERAASKVGNATSEGGTVTGGGGRPLDGGPQPPHPQPMTISVSMNGVDFVVVGDKPPDRGKGSRGSKSAAGGGASKGRASLASREGEGNSSGGGNGGGGGGGWGVSHAEAVKKGLQLRARGLGPELKHRLLYNFYALAPFQLTTVHPRLLTLPTITAPLGGSGRGSGGAVSKAIGGGGPASSASTAELPVYLYIGGFGLYETSAIAVRLTAPGKKPIVCTSTEVVWLEAGASGEGEAPAGSDEAAAQAAGQAGSSSGGGGSSSSDDQGDGSDGAPCTGLYVRVKLNDVVKELDETGRLPFETSSIAVALNGQDFVALQGQRDDSSVMLYRAKLDAYHPFAVPAVAPADPKDSDPNGFGVPLTLKGSGFFRVDKRASCGDKTWHLKLRLAEPLPEPNSADAAEAPGLGRQASLGDAGGGDGDDDPAAGEAAAAQAATAAAARRKRRLGPEVLVPCRFEDNFTLTALLPPFPLRGGYLAAFNRRAKGSKAGASLANAGGSAAWPSPWPSVAQFTVEVVMARDSGNLARLWEQKAKDGVVALPPPPSYGADRDALAKVGVAAAGKGNGSGGDHFALPLPPTAEDKALPKRLCVYSLPGMGPGASGPMALTLTCAAGSFAAGQLVEFAATDPAATLFESSPGQPGQAKVRFAFCSADGNSFVRAFPLAGADPKKPPPPPVDSDEGDGASGRSARGEEDHDNASVGGDSAEEGGDFSVASSVGGRFALGDPEDPALEPAEDDDDEVRASKLAEQSRRRAARQAYEDAQAADALAAQQAASAATPLIWYVDVPATVVCVDVLEPAKLLPSPPPADKGATAVPAGSSNGKASKCGNAAKGGKASAPKRTPEEEATEAAAAAAAASAAAAALVCAPPVVRPRWVVRCRAPGLARRLAGGVNLVVPDPEPAAGGPSSPRAAAAPSRAVSRQAARKQQEAAALAEAAEAEARALKRAPPPPWRGMPKRVTCRAFVALNGVHFHDWPSLDNPAGSSAPVDHAAFAAGRLAGGGGSLAKPSVATKGSAKTNNGSQGGSTAASATPAAKRPGASFDGGGGGSLASSFDGGSLDGSIGGQDDGLFLYGGPPLPMHTTVFTYLAFGGASAVENVVCSGGALRPGSTLTFEGANLPCVPGLTRVRLTEVTFPGGGGPGSVDDDDRSIAASAAGDGDGDGDSRAFPEAGDGSEPPAAVEGARSVIVLGTPSNGARGGGVSCVVPDFGVGAGTLLLKAELFLGGMRVVEAKSGGEGGELAPTYTAAPLEYAGGAPEEEALQEAEGALLGENDEAALAL
jgi:alpha-tubulin suppressor-like RCC1 family protein